ncbi:MAG: hypothetical protein ABIQ31_06365 [Ferruginibacter sp.]
MIKNILLPICLFFALSAFSQAGTEKYRSVYDTTGTVKVYYLTTDTARVNNPSLLPPGTAVILYDADEKPIGQYILNDVRTWIVTLGKKEF